MIPQDLRTVLDTITSGELAGAHSPRQWGVLIRAARRANLLASLAHSTATSAASIPDAARRHLDGAHYLSQRQAESVRWEAHSINQILAPLGVPAVLLKGAAYVLAETPNHRGRLFGDIDILVPQAALGAVEKAFMINGWTHSITDTYDQRYYREWMHELPPMINVRRGTVVDIHHNILPSTARYSPTGQAVIDASSPLPGLPAIRIPSPEDLLIHSITHLFHEGELHNGLRDLVDIDALIRHSSQTPDFWEKLIARARQQTLERPLYYGLHFTRQLLGTPIPEATFDSLKAAAPPGWILAIMETLYQRGFPAAVGLGHRAGRWVLPLLYIRAHWLRMPPHLLARHLVKKAWRQLVKKEKP